MVHLANKYSQLCSMHSLNQLIRSPTRVAKATSTLLDHKKQKKSKIYKHKTIKTSLKIYTAENLCDKPNDVNFANYSEFDDVNNAFVDFSDKLMQAVDGIAPYREFRVKRHREDWFDGEIMERIKNRDKLLKIKIGS